MAAQSARTFAGAQGADPLHALLTATITGDQSAFKALYDATSGRLFSVAVAVLGNAADAEEAVAEVYTQAWRNADRYDTARGSVMTWLSMMCRSRALDALRRQRVQLDSLDENALPPMEETQWPDAGASRALSGALEQLNPMQRQMVALAFFRGLTHQEIADVTEQPLGTVKSHIRRALLTMKELLGDGAGLN